MFLPNLTKVRKSSILPNYAGILWTKPEFCVRSRNFIRKSRSAENECRTEFAKLCQNSKNTDGPLAKGHVTAVDKGPRRGLVFEIHDLALSLAGSCALSLSAKRGLQERERERLWRPRRPWCVASTPLRSIIVFFRYLSKRNSAKLWLGLPNFGVLVLHGIETEFWD